MSERARLGRLAGLLNLLAAGLLVGTAVELLTVEHYADRLQLIPFALCTAGLLALVGAWRWPGRPMALAVRAVMGLLVLGSALGAYFHVVGNIEFAREIAPRIGGVALAKDAVAGGNPLLAPGALAVAAAIALAATFAAPVGASAVADQPARQVGHPGRNLKAPSLG